VEANRYPRYKPAIVFRERHMSDGPHNSLVSRFMRSLDINFGRMADDIREIKGRAGTLEKRYASVSRRLDALEPRFERIGCRLNERTP